MYQLVLLWEAASDFSESFWRLFQCVCPFHDGWLTSSPADTLLSVQQFLTKNGMTPVPHSPYLPDLAPSDFCFVDEKTPQREIFCQYWRDETKNGRSTKRHHNQQVQKPFCTAEKTSQYVYFIKWKVLWSWLKIKHVRINTQFFINEFQVFWVPHHIIA